MTASDDPVFLQAGAPVVIQGLCEKASNLLFKEENPMRIRTLVIGGIALALIIAGAILKSGMLIICGVLGVVTTLRFTQLDRWEDPNQTEMYLPLYREKKEEEDKKKR